MKDKGNTMKTTTDALVEALEALEKTAKAMLSVRDGLAERGGRPTTNQSHQKLWDLSYVVYTETAIPAAEKMRAALALARAEQAEPVPSKPCRVNPQYRGPSNCNYGTVGCTEAEHRTTPPAPVPQPVQVEPDGWRLVPVEPTPAMLDVAVSHALMVGLSSEYGWTAYMREIWARMLKAAHGITPKEGG